jgi:hypothetical protein
MLSASPNFVRGLRYSHRVLARVSLINPLTDSVIDTLDIVSGSMTLDARSNMWRQVSMQITSPWAEKLDALDVTTVLRIERGLRYFEGEEEWIPVGDFFVQELTTAYTSRTVTVTGYDIGSRIEDYRLITPYAPQTEAGDPLTFVAAIEDLITIVVPDASIAVDAGVDTSATAPLGTVFSGSRWDAINELAKSIGAVVHPTVNNAFRIQKVDADAAPVWEVSSGASGVLVDARSVRSRREQYNAVHVRWETPNGTGVALVVDSDSDSPTYWNGPFGRKPAPEESLPAVASNSAATAAAIALLNQYKGFSRSLSFTSITNPLLEPLDVVRVKTPDGASDDYVIDSISYGLGEATMSCETRLVRSVTA